MYIYNIYMDNLKKGQEQALNFIKSDSKIGSIIKAIVGIILIIYLLDFIKKIYIQTKKWLQASPWLLKATKDGKKRMVILQDPSSFGSIPVYKSENQYAGLEFSYAMWINIDDWSYRYGSWKHILHKGNETSWPLRTPGIWLHPKENSLRVYMNTYKNIGEHVDLKNLPLGKWFHIVVAVKQNKLDIYLNGNLAKRHELEALPKQNWGDIYINSFRGFGGYLSNIRYYNWYTSFSDIDRALNTPPSTSGCVDTKGIIPPYFSTTWWANQN